LALLRLIYELLKKTVFVANQTNRQILLASGVNLKKYKKTVKQRMIVKK